jgi:nitroreductase
LSPTQLNGGIPTGWLLHHMSKSTTRPSAKDHRLSFGYNQRAADPSKGTAIGKRQLPDVDKNHPDGCARSMWGPGIAFTLTSLVRLMVHGMALISRRTALGAGLSLAAVGAVGYGLWPRMGGYRDEVDRQRQLLSDNPTIKKLVRLAILAANAYNTQPWKFRLEDQKAGILPDFTRQTAVVDPDGHHIFVSLGCATENLVIAGKALGRVSEVAIGAGKKPQIEISWSPAPPVWQAPYQAIPLRQSTRSIYNGQSISSAEKGMLAAAAQEADVSVLFFTEPADREAIPEFMIQGNSAQMDDPAFVQELADWIRFSPASAIETGDGLFAACSGNPVLPDWIGPTLFGVVFRKAAENDKYRDQIRSSAGIAVFVGDRADPEHWIRVGRSLQRFALQATALGIRNAHVNQPIEVPSVRPEFARWLGMPDLRPDLVIRFGRAPAMPMPLRRPVSAVLT